MSGSLTIHRYECKGGSIVATQVTASNFAEIADWTGGATHPRPGSDQHPAGRKDP